MSKKLSILLVFCVCCAIPKSGWALETTSGIESQLKQLIQTVNDLKLIVESQQREIATLKMARQEAPSVLQAPASRALQGRWNPDIGVVADTVLLLDSPKEDEEGADRVSVRELEVVFGSAVDPYSRLDVTLAISDFEEMALEEAYLTRFGLPWDLKARVGKFKPRVGKAIPVHRDSLDTVDEPLVIQRWFGVEGYNKSGVDMSRLLDLPWPVVHEVSFGVLEGGNGEEGTAFGETRRRPTLYSHLKNFLDIDDVTSLEAGVSHLVGSRDEDASFEVQILGLDGTFIHHFSPTQSIKLQGEVFYMSREESAFDLEDETTGEIFSEDIDDNRNLWGGYALIDLRVHPQWSIGARYDDVQLVDGSIAGLERADRGYTGYVTFYQSEFARWRAQYNYIDHQDGLTESQVLIQGTFAIGEHKHKLQ
ncbi:MAG: hypothetical protein ACREH5_02375 [Candidatus Omnitrophota bacterium]